MRRFVPPLLAFTALGLAAGGAASWSWNSAGGGSAAAEVAAETLPGPSGTTRAAEQVALRAVEAQLRRAGHTAPLQEVKLIRLGEGEELAVCATLPSASGAPADVVARVILSSLAIRDARTGQPARGSQPLVVMEDAPGLWRGGAPGEPRRRYCGTQPRQGAEPVLQAAASAATQGAPAAGAASSGPTATVTVLNPVRVRAAPSGQAEILWVAERGRAFHVHGQAPGGWVQIGDEVAPAGWAHGTLLSPAPL
ncbi:SH3 domain-containing protein [Falsiroseomonas tokyonensis]|uniref:SH3 domain-containing protein n=1 Tax=Falsiroseomonas tokyonensis TaxID=430521 RepID=A0ABV7BUJ7_9PROT|nr:SH3 domain-containing protein [Falsiroseomonas tokyonensis]MBU8539185.1 SH3 domain-containing protein [Falsiroseomonas tokyonensis]